MMGGKTSFSYQYDDLYRLTDSTGTFDTKPDKQHAYTLSMQYDTIHNIKQKTQLHTLRQPGGQKITQQKTSYDWAYQYDGQQPHAPTHLGDRTFSYDANGNQLGWTHDKNGTRRTITWDEENRIQNIQDNGHTFTYTYDGSGQRMTKRGPQGETGYINQWMTLRNGEVGTKHVFVGTTRVVSKLVKQDKPNSKRNSENNTDNNGKGKARIVYEKDQYYFHPDHLGTTAYITHTNGQVYQHLEYFPFGETWVEEHSNKQRTPYLFTGKELDEETGLYYFGARYYDPRMSVWTSTDPILSAYLGSSPSSLQNGGVFNGANLSLFGYGYNNPVRFMDPDGNAPRDGLRAVASLRNEIKSAAADNGVSEQAIASIVFQEKYHGLWASAKNLAAFMVDGGVHDGVPATRSYGFGEMQLGLAADLLGLDINQSGAKEEAFNVLTMDASSAMDLVAKNLKLAEASTGRPLTVEEATVFHNAGEGGLRSYMSGGYKKEGAVYNRSWNWQGAIGKALGGMISPVPDSRSCSGQGCRAPQESMHDEVWQYDNM